jgi:Flp pilus assembly pilin Flp
MKIREFIQDERGIETQVLVFILAAVILVMLISVMTGVIGKASNMIDTAITKANNTLNASL